MPPTVLFVDNDRDFLRLRSQVLSESGYDVLPAASAAEAKEILSRRHVDIAVIDLRLEDEGPHDHSGITLANTACRETSTIILAGRPDMPAVLEALRGSASGQSAIVDFLDKTEGLKAQLDSMARQLRKRVFIVHGHDHEARQTVARFVERLSLRAIILGEQRDIGRAVIQKFEDHTNVPYAIVLLTPDDVGGTQANRQSSDKLRPRARQNVVFELGYFVGKLGRGRVAVLYKDEVEMPSDYNGVAYIHMQPGDAWKLELARNMQHAGVEFDMARVPGA